MSNRISNVDTPFANSWAEQEARRRAGDPTVPPLVKPGPMPCARGCVIATLTAADRRVYPLSNG